MFIWFFFFKQKTAYEMRISDWSSDVCSSDLFDGVLCTLRWCVAAVEEGMQVDLLGAALGRQLGHGDQMILMAVHATVGEKAEDVHRLAGHRGLVDGGTEGRVGDEDAITARLGTPGAVRTDESRVGKRGGRHRI